MSLAVISVSDKSGLVEFSKSLSQLGWEFLASGGTARHLRKAGLAVQEIASMLASWRGPPLKTRNNYSISLPGRLIWW